MEEQSEHGPLTRGWNAWVQFWFTPADPTPLCLMRIVAGLLTLYVHVAYSLDLVEFFGPDAWCSQQLSNDIRKTLPHLGPNPGWREREYSFTMPADSHQR